MVIRKERDLNKAAVAGYVLYHQYYIYSNHQSRLTSMLLLFRVTKRVFFQRGGANEA